MTVNRGGATHELGAGLRKLREDKGIVLRDLAVLAGSSAANISNWERAERLISEDRLIRLLDALEVTEDERERLLGLRRQAEGPGQLMSGPSSIGEQLAKLIEYEQVARKITAVAPLVIPGLLQTSDYARATLDRHQDIDTRVALRIGRRDILTRKRNPVELVAVLDSEVLVRPVVPPDTMVDQLRHLLAMAELPNVTIQVRQSTLPGYSPIQGGPFILLEFATATPIVHLEHYSSSVSLWKEEDVHQFADAANEVRNEAMTPARSAEVIAEIANGMETTTR